MLIKTVSIISIDIFAIIISQMCNKHIKKKSHDKEQLKVCKMAVNTVAASSTICAIISTVKEAGVV